MNSKRRCRNHIIYQLCITVSDIKYRTFKNIESLQIETYFNDNNLRRDCEGNDDIVFPVQLCKLSLD